MFFLTGGLSAALQLFSTYFLAEWAGKPFEEQQKSYYPIVFAALILSFFAANMLRAVTYFAITLTAANNMHGAMIDKISRAPILFFDSNPVGRIMTRLSKDMTILDL